MGTLADFQSPVCPMTWDTHRPKLQQRYSQDLMTPNGLRPKMGDVT